MKRPQMQNPVISPATVLFLGLLLFEPWYPTASHKLDDTSDCLAGEHAVPASSPGYPGAASLKPAAMLEPVGLHQLQKDTAEYLCRQRPVRAGAAANTPPLNSRRHALHNRKVVNAEWKHRNHGRQQQRTDSTLKSPRGIILQPSAVEPV